MNLSYIFKSLQSKGISDLVVADTATEYISKEDISGFNIVNIADVRAAGFVALGKSQTLSKPVAIVVESSYLDSLYTSLVETWFQHVPVVVIVLDTEDGTDYELYRRCVDIYNDYRKESQSEISISASRPTFVIYPVEKISNMTSMSHILEKLPKDIEVYRPEDKYCAISKYAGYLCGTEKKVTCMIPLSWVKWDLNIFNNRYLDSRFKLILLSCGEEINCQLHKWLSSNHIKMYEGENNLHAFVREESPSVIIIS